MKLCGREAGSDSPTALKYPFLQRNRLFPLLLALKRAFKGYPPPQTCSVLPVVLQVVNSLHPPWCSRIL